ncbi:hypothetical protein EHM76_02870 [bacterium]|nr:MAG: hypothetical protein EHM76_02870 [bacterium]
MGEIWLKRKKIWAEEYIGSRITWYKQLERDIAILSSRVGSDRLIKCYQPLLRDKKSIWTTLYEIHVAALIASISTEFELHVPRGDQVEEL